MSLMLRHMFLRVLAYAAAISGVLSLVALLSVTQPLFYLMAKGAISPGSFLLSLALLAPGPLYHVAPLSLVAALAHAYVTWSRHNEIVTLRMAGLPDWTLALPGLGAAVVAATVTASMSLYALPAAFREFEDIQYTANFNLSLNLLDEGYLQQVAPGLAISFRERLAADEIAGVTVLDSRKADSTTYILAERAQLQRSREPSGERAVVLQRGSYQVRSASEQVAAPIDFQELILPLAESADGSSPTRQWRGAYEQHIGVLLNPPQKIIDKPPRYGEYIAEGHKRLTMPLLCLSLAIFTLGIVLTASYRRHSAPIQNIIVVFAGAALSIGSLEVIHAVVFRIPTLAFTFYLLAAIPGAIGALLLARTARPAGRALRRPDRGPMTLPRAGRATRRAADQPRA